MIKGPPSPFSLKKVNFHQNQPINEEIDVFLRERGGEAYHKLISKLLLVNI